MSDELTRGSALQPTDPENYRWRVGRKGGEEPMTNVWHCQCEECGHNWISSLAVDEDAPGDDPAAAGERCPACDSELIDHWREQQQAEKA